MRKETSISFYSRYIELILYKTYADLRSETERTYLGFLWWIFEPIMYMSIFYVMFGVLLGHRTDDYVPFLLVGLTVWQWFKSCLSHASETILGAHFLMKHVHLPKIIFPIILILMDTVKFLFIFSLLLVFLWLLGYTVNEHYWSLPAIFMVQLLLITACSLILAAIVPFLPDLRFVVENVLTAVFFMSGVFLDVSKLAHVLDFHKQLYYLNPMVNLIEAFRNVLMYNQAPNWQALAIITIFSLLGIWFGKYLIDKFEYVYPKVMP